MAIVAPALFILLMLVIFAGRVTDAKQQVASAAHAAARAASMRNSVETASAAAQQAAEDNLSDGGITCTPAEVALMDTQNFHPNGFARVRVRCTVDLAGLVMTGIPASQTFTETATEVIDRYRGIGG